MKDIRSNCGIYAIINTKNRSRYIGSSQNLSKRKNTHFRDLKKGNHHCVRLQRSYAKYKESIIFEILCCCSVDNLLELEQYFLDISPNLLNSSKDAKAPMRGRKHSKKVREYLSDLHKGNRYNVGRVASLETKLKMKLARTGLSRSLEFKKKRSLEAKADNRCKYLYPYIEKMKRAVICSNGVEYESLTRAAEALDVHPSCICDNLKGRSRSLRNGLTFKYKYNEDIK